MKGGRHYSSCLSLSTGSPLLYTLYTHDCTPTHSSNTTIKFADDTTVVRLISEGDESTYRDEVEQLLVWCIENNITKTEELIIDCRRKKTDIQPLFINGDSVERTSNFWFLGVHLDDDLTWPGAPTPLLPSRTHQRLYFLNQLTQKLLVSFYRCAIESILTYCICVWFSSCTVAERKALQRDVNTAQKIIGCPLPSLEDRYSSHCLRKANYILRDPSPPGHTHFELLPSGRRYRSMKTQTNRLNKI